MSAPTPPDWCLGLAAPASCVRCVHDLRSGTSPLPAHRPPLPAPLACPPTPFPPPPPPPPFPAPRHRRPPPQLPLAGAVRLSVPLQRMAGAPPSMNRTHPPQAAAAVARQGAAARRGGGGSSCGEAAVRPACPGGGAHPRCPARPSSPPPPHISCCYIMPSLLLLLLLLLLGQRGQEGGGGCSRPLAGTPHCGAPPSARAHTLHTCARYPLPPCCCRQSCTHAASCSTLRSMSSGVVEGRHRTTSSLARAHRASRGGEERGAG